MCTTVMKSSQPISHVSTELINTADHLRRCHCIQSLGMLQILYVPLCLCLIQFIKFSFTS